MRSTRCIRALIWDSCYFFWALFICTTDPSCAKIIWTWTVLIIGAAWTWATIVPCYLLNGWIRDAIPSIWTVIIIIALRTNLRVTLRILNAYIPVASSWRNFCWIYTIILDRRANFVYARSGLTLQPVFALHTFASIISMILSWATCLFRTTFIFETIKPRRTNLFSTIIKARCSFTTINGIFISGEITIVILA